MVNDNDGCMYVLLSLTYHCSHLHIIAVISWPPPSIHNFFTQALEGYAFYSFLCGFCILQNPKAGQRPALQFVLTVFFFSSTAREHP